MIGILVSGHGNFASGLTTALELLAGPQEAYQAVDFLPEHSADELKEKMQKAVAELGACDSVLILADLTGGTPYNVASKLRLEQMEASKAPALEVIGGANLGGVMEACMTRQLDCSVKELVASVCRAAKEQVVHFQTEKEAAKAAPVKTVKLMRRANPDGPKGEIVHARVDERLIHGQVAMVWTNTVGATRILVANDEALKDEMVLSGLKMAKPGGCKSVYYYGSACREAPEGECVSGRARLRYHEEYCGYGKADPRRRRD